MTIKQEVVDLETARGAMRCQIFRPERAGKFATVIFYSEIFQITAPIARTAALVAGHGYVVIVPEVFHELNEPGTVLAYDEVGKDKGNADKFEKPLSAHDRDTEVMIAWLDRQDFCNGALGSFGVCLGGHLAFRAALNPRVQAASCLYATDIHSETIPAGAGEQTINLLENIKGEIMCVWGKQDPHVPLEGRRLLHERFTASKFNFSWHELNAQHAFMRDEGERYDSELALMCYRLTLDLMARCLRV